MQSRQKQLAMRRKRGSKQQVVAEKPRSRLPFYGLAIVVLVAGACASFAIVGHYNTPTNSPALRKAGNAGPRSIHEGPITLWWDEVPDWIRQRSVATGTTSNIRLVDYVGPESCQKCHEKNYRSWSTHPHRWMNAVADETTVKGDFSGDETISYLGGRATFYRHQSEFRMRLDRDEQHRVYQIFQTLGSRFQQYYIGKLLEGPEPLDHAAYRTNHVLPFGYWLGPGEWVPTVHVHWVMVDGDLADEEELPDGKRPDPFAKEVVFAPYAERCSHCHTTMPLGDLLIRNISTLGLHAPLAIDLSLPQYLGESHAQLWRSTELTDMKSFEQLATKMQNLEPVDHAATLGISCEACHLGSREHAEGSLTKPLFFPVSNSLFVEQKKAQLGYGRTHGNLNWACGRCHAGHRPQFAAGMSTWNSTEYSDAMRGSCYSELRCIDCHDPHMATGQKWQRTPTQDDTLCLNCHQQYETDEARSAHTHHAPDSSGSHCMDCHMPRLNEGMQDVVRTHTIFSPTRREMIESNQPNACNLCHTDQTIEWTVEHLHQWYGDEYSKRRIAGNYPQPKRPATINWLQNDFKAARLVAADALARTKAKWALPELIDALDDPYLLNRQFAQTGLESMLEIQLSDYDYRYYMSPAERREAIARLREAFLDAASE